MNGMSNINFKSMKYEGNTDFTLLTLGKMNMNYDLTEWIKIQRKASVTLYFVSHYFAFTAVACFQYIY